MVGVRPQKAAEGTYYSRHRDKIREKVNARRRDNREAHRARERDYYRRSKEKRRAYQKDWYDANKHTVRERTKDNQYRAKYGFGIEYAREILNAQEDVCVICEEPLDIGGWDGGNVDHDHKTGEVRGILCTHCNKGLGCFKDRPMLLIRASHYLIRLSGAANDN